MFRVVCLHLNVCDETFLYIYIVAILTACPSQINFLCKISQYYLAKYNKYL